VIALSASRSVRVLGRLGDQDQIRRAARATTRHGRLVRLEVAVEGNHVYLVLTFSTGDAAGQNMTTLGGDR
jgi:hydroxymethylglutaryl-CoA reductase (NADPH)